MSNGYYRGRGVAGESSFEKIGIGIGELLGWFITKGKRDRDADVGKVMAAMQRAETTGEREPLVHIAQAYPAAVLEWEKRTGRAFPVSSIMPEVSEEPIPLPAAKYEPIEQLAPTQLPAQLSPTERLEPTPLPPAPTETAPMRALTGVGGPPMPPAVGEPPVPAGGGPIPYPTTSEGMAARQFFEEQRAMPGLQESLARWGAISQVSKGIPEELLPAFTEEVRQYMPGVQMTPPPLEPFTTADMERINKLWGPLSAEESRAALTRREIPNRAPNMEEGKPAMSFADFVKFYSPDADETRAFLESKGRVVPSRAPTPITDEGRFYTTLYLKAVEASVLTGDDPNIVYGEMLRGRWDSTKYTEEKKKQEYVLSLRRHIMDLQRAGEPDEVLKDALKELADAAGVPYEPSLTIWQQLQKVFGATSKYAVEIPTTPNLTTGAEFEEHLTGKK